MLVRKRGDGGLPCFPPLGSFDCDPLPWHQAVPLRNCADFPAGILGRLRKRADLDAR